MNTQIKKKVSGTLALIALLAFMAMPATGYADGIDIIDNRCVAGDGVVETQLPSDVESFTLKNNTTGQTVDSGDISADFKTFSDLPDGDYTLTAYTASGQATTTFTVDCDEPEPETVVTLIGKRCVNGDGVVEVELTNVNSFSLSGPVNESQQINADFKTFSDLPDGDYTLDVEGDGGSDTLSFVIDCDAPQLSGSCSVNPDNPKTGDTVTWEASASGGNGSYNYSWSGDASGNSRTVNETYSSAGNKSATVTITSGNQQIKKTCGVNVTDKPEPETIVTLTDKRCVSGDGVVEVELRNVNSFTLSGPTNDSGQINADFKTFSDLADGDYTLDVSGAGGSDTLSFVIDCDEPEDPEPESCPFVDNGNNEWVVDDFSDNRLASQGYSISNKETNSTAVNLPSGTYNIDIFTTDAYAHRVDADQPHEQAYLSLRNNNGEVARTGATNDLADKQASAATITSFSNVAVDSQITSLVGVHAFFSNTQSPNSLNFTCAKLVKQTDDSEEPDISIIDQRCVDGDGVVEIDTPNGLDSYKLINTATGNTVATDTNGADSGFITFSDLPDGNYRFEGRLDGNTQTLNFTVDCDDDEPSLSGSCSVDPDNADIGEDVTWSANASGGDGSHSYSWNLEGSNDDANTRTVTTEYNQTGTYNGTVTITDDSGEEITRTCSVRVRDNDDDDDNGGGGGDRLDPRDDDDGRVRGDRDEDFSVQCLPETSVYRVGETVLFEASIDGDIDEDDVDFDWSGDVELDEDDNEATARYTSGGVKKVTVRAEYDGDEETDDCYVQVGRGEGVTLDQVPYTGPGDAAKTLAFLTFLLLMGLAGGYTIIKRKEGDGIPVGIPTNHS